MVTAEEKAMQIYMSFVKSYDPFFGILIKKHVKQKAIQASIVYCKGIIEELELILQKLGYRPNEGNCYYIDHPLQRLSFYQETKTHLESMK